MSAGRGRRPAGGRVSFSCGCDVLICRGPAAGRRGEGEAPPRGDVNTRGSEDSRLRDNVSSVTRVVLLRLFSSLSFAEMSFPSSFTSTERAFIHRLCQSLGLISKSKG